LLSAWRSPKLCGAVLRISFNTLYAHGASVQVDNYDHNFVIDFPWYLFHTAATLAPSRL